MAEQHCKTEATEIYEQRPQPETRKSQQDMHAQYLEQQRRMLCPGCGEGYELF